MPDPVTWGALAKAVGDNTLVSDEIATLILNHNLDPSAHGQSNEAVYNHRISELLDHVNYSIYNIKTALVARPFKAICDQGGAGDFENIQQAVDYVHLYGGGKILITQGNWVIPSDIVLYSNIIIEGADKELTILDFNNTAYQIKAIGSSGTHLRNIELHNLQIHDGCGTDQKLLDFQYVDDVEVTRCKFDHNQDHDTNQMFSLSFANCARLLVEDNDFETCDSCVSMYNCDFYKVQGNRMNTIASVLMYSNNSDNGFFRENMGNDNGGGYIADALIIFTGTYRDVIINANNLTACKLKAIWGDTGDRCVISDNSFEADGADDGIYINGANKSVFVGNRVYGFSAAGIFLGSNSNDCVLVGNVCTNGGAYGIDIADSDCDRNVVVGNNLTYNSTAGLHNAGTGTVSGNNAV